ncbi:MAG: indolepyruvate oxidoreductase subunit beta [Armatimonadetes bacterium]|nr:indolepyruvate oxidoreductase subunit beta [Armatimonadota bacterium]
MKHDIIIAGVGGQGILTIARVLSLAATAKGLFVKQAEVHGMSQRGGAVYSHLRISDSEIFSDLIPAGKADMILAIEPLEALRYAPMLRQGGAVVASTNAEVNIPDYPAIESVLGHVASLGNHIAIDMEKLARAAGGVLSTNVVALGAASVFLGFTMSELQHAVEKLFESKGERVVQTNTRALRFGRTAAVAYQEALQRNVNPQNARGWIATLSAEHLASEDDLDFTELSNEPDLSRLTGAEAHAFKSLLMTAYEQERTQLYEHEVYRLIELVGAITPPLHTFIPKGSTIAEDVLAHYPGDKVVLKLVSRKVVHKTEAGAVLILSKEINGVRLEIDQMIATHTAHVPVAGVLVVEFVEHDSHGLGSELFVGIRSTREFGPVIAAGLGGLQTEYLAAKMRPGVAVAKAPVSEVNADQFLELFKETAAYDVLAGRIRGHKRTVSDSELLRCFRAFISIARQFCIDRGEEGPDIGELEVNPFAFSGERLVPLDGRGSLRPASNSLPARPINPIRSLLEPKTIALVGVSSRADSLSRIIVHNILACGIDRSRVSIIKADSSDYEGLPCYASIASVPDPIDLLVITVPASAVASIVNECGTSGNVRSAIIISGGAGESEGSESIGDDIRAAIQRGRSMEGGGTVFLGPNCMGVRSLPGMYDTFFVPEDKLPPRRSRTPQPVAIISQSGAFIVSRLSSQTQLHPRFAISIGNQCDVTVSDLINAMSERDDIQVVGVYLEGFVNLDGTETLHAVERMASVGKTVVFYKAGRTESGRSAVAGHTAAVAGDYDICQTAMRSAGAFVVDNFREFGQAIDLALGLSSRTVGEGRVFAVTNAGMEAVAMADAGSRFEPLSELLRTDLEAILSSRKLSGLVSPRNPLDLTPQANEDVFDDVVCAALDSEEVDAVIISCVPLAPGLKTLEDTLAEPQSFVNLARKWLSRGEKAVVFAIDGGPEYDELVSRIRETGVPVFRSADEAARLMKLWVQHRSHRL